MDARAQIQAEKLANILDPREANQQFKVTVRFEKNLTRSFPRALEIARRNRFFMTEGEGDATRYYASFLPADVEELYELFELVKEFETTRITLNHKPIPYIHDLWLFLMWFHRVR
ncbi:MAG TPA: hypothetical protein PKK12_14325 [Candidatus Aminicenantes bacterium]|mgnify:CR=1 FL=1|nr:hypothetical protein [Candidatus Aminicenantes bacterium]